MHKRAFFVLSIAISLALTGCGGGAGGGVPAQPASNDNSGNTNNNSGSGPTTASDITGTEDLFNLDNSDLLAMLEADAGVTGASSVLRRDQDRLTPSPVHGLTTTGPFLTQITGGTATIARSGTQTTAAIGFLLTYRDSKGLCECANGSHTLPPPYKTNITNPLWHASPFATLASTTTLGIGLKNNVDSSNHGGTYTATVAKPPGGTASFAIKNAAIALPRQSNPAVTTSGGNVTVTWVPASGTKEFFVAFLTHLNDDPVHNPSFTVVGFVITPKTSVSIPLSNFYANAQYEVMLIDSDQRYTSVYQSQGSQQAPALPAQIDFSVSQVVLFKTP